MTHRPSLAGKFKNFITRWRFRERRPAYTTAAAATTASECWYRPGSVPNASGAFFAAAAAAAAEVKPQQIVIPSGAKSFC
mmetsp:Transcript_13575/g.27513  ORF Transcript_13575/g.27513 Transcript_13575/m.27513 type:complete len:80 (+) Transcript_13575:830-1069(+)